MRRDIIERTREISVFWLGNMKCTNYRDHVPYFSVTCSICNCLNVKIVLRANSGQVTGRKRAGKVDDD